MSSYNLESGVFEGVPTIEQVDEFIDMLNTGRKAAGLPVIVKFEDYQQGKGGSLFEFDGCTPGNPHECLSALNFATLVGCASGADCFRVFDREMNSERPMSAIGAEKAELSLDGWLIPDAIRAVTDPFDQSDKEGPFTDDVTLYRNIREVFVKAGWVA